jgi:DNA-binding NarL/FixJ family response regulator
MINVLIADDHEIVRDGVRQMLDAVDDIGVIGEVCSGDELLAWLGAGGQADLLLMDMTMPGLSSVELVTKVREQSSIPMLILTMHSEYQIANGAIRAGANGFITKSSSSRQLFDAIRKVASGGRYVAAEVIEQMVFGKGSIDPTALHEKLSEREYYILSQLVRGRSINDIAEGLGISNKTVSTYKLRMMEKMNFASNADMMRYAIMHGLG